MFPKTPGGELAGGGLLALWIVLITGGNCWLLLFLAGKAGTAVWFLTASVMNYYLLAARSLRDESMKSTAPDRGKGGGGASGSFHDRRRDTDRLDAEGITRAAVETVAENASDGVIAPLLYLLAGGPVLGWAYKAINTMDSMVGYRNDRYLYFGRRQPAWTIWQT